MDDTKVRYGFKSGGSTDSMFADFMRTVGLGVWVGLIVSILSGAVILVFNIVT